MLLNFCKIPRKSAVLESLKLLHSLFSSNISEFIRLVLNFLFFFYKKISQVQKSAKPFTANKNKKCVFNTSKGKKVTYSLICVLCFCLFVFLCFQCFLVLLVLLVRAKSFCKKIKSLNGLKKLVFRRLKGLSGNLFLINVTRKEKLSSNSLRETLVTSQFTALRLLRLNLLESKMVLLRVVLREAWECLLL